MEAYQLLTRDLFHSNPSNTEATFVQSTRISDEYPYAKVSVIIPTFSASFCSGKISHQQHTG